VSEELGTVARPAPEIDDQRRALDPDPRDQVGRRPGPLRLEPPVQARVPVAHWPLADRTSDPGAMSTRSMHAAK